LPWTSSTTPRPVPELLALALALEIAALNAAVFCKSVLPSDQPCASGVVMYSPVLAAAAPAVPSSTAWDAPSIS